MEYEHADRPDVRQMPPGLVGLLRTLTEIANASAVLEIVLTDHGVAAELDEEMRARLVDFRGSLVDKLDLELQARLVDLSGRLDVDLEQMSIVLEKCSAMLRKAGAHQAARLLDESSIGLRAGAGRLAGLLATAGRSGPGDEARHSDWGR